MISANVRPDLRADDGLRRFLAGGDRDTPPDVEPGSDADIDRGDEAEDDDEAEDGDEAGSEAVEPSPDDVVTQTGQMDDNIDDLGRRPDGTRQEQPGTDEVIEHFSRCKGRREAVRV